MPNLSNRPQDEVTSQSQQQLVGHDAVYESKCALTEGQRFREENQELKDAIDQLMEEKERLSENFEELRQELQHTRHELRTTQSRFQSQELYVQSAEQAYEQVSEELKRYKQMVKESRRETKGLEDELKFRDQTIDDLQEGLEEKDSLVEVYESWLKETNSDCWIEDLTNWYRSMVEERDMLREFLYRVVGMCEGMEKAFIGYMGLPSVVGDGTADLGYGSLQGLRGSGTQDNSGDSMLVDPPNILAEGSSSSSFQDNTHGQSSSGPYGGDAVSGLVNIPIDTSRPSSDPRNHLTLEEEMQSVGKPSPPSPTGNQANNKDEREDEYEPPESFPSSSPTKGGPNSEEEGTSDSSQPTLDEVDIDQDDWHHISNTFLQGSADGPDTLHKDVLDLLMSDAETLQGGMKDETDINPVEPRWGWQGRVEDDKHSALVKTNGPPYMGKKLRVQDSVMDDVLTDEQMAIVRGGEVATPEKRVIPDPPLPASVTINMLQFDIPSKTFPTTCAVPHFESLAVPPTSSNQENTDAGNSKDKVSIDAKNAASTAGTGTSDKKAKNVKSGSTPNGENRKNISGTWKPFPSNCTGVVHFPDKIVRAQVPQRRPPSKVRPVMDLRRIKISPSLQVAGYQAVHDAAVVENPSIPPVTYDMSQFYMNVDSELVPIQDPYIYVGNDIASVTKKPYSEKCDIEWQNHQRTLASNTWTKWVLLLFCIAFLYCMWSLSRTNNESWMEANEVPRGLHTMMQESGDSEFHFVQVLTYEMAKRLDIEPVSLG